MELHAHRTRDPETPGASRRWPAASRAVTPTSAQAAADWRYLIVIAAIIVLVALAGASPQL